MNFNGRYESAVSRCETIAKNQGHIPGVWQPVDERLHAIVCELCSMIAWVSRSGDEERWRIGGHALQEECIGEDAAIGDLVIGRAFKIGLPQTRESANCLNP